MISVIFPITNGNIKEVKRILLKYTKFLKTNFNKYEMIFVCNGCKSKIVDEIKKYSKKNRKIILLNYPKRIGKGMAIRCGFKIAKGNIVGFIDADDSFEINGIKKLIEEIKGSDMVIASKWKGKSFFEVNQPFSRKIFGRLWNFLVRILFNLKFHDTQAGAKFLKREILKKIENRFLTYGFEFDVELILRVLKLKASVKEIFVRYIKKEETSLRLIDIFSMFFNLIKLKLFISIFKQ